MQFQPKAGKWQLRTILLVNALYNTKTGAGRERDDLAEIQIIVLKPRTGQASSGQQHRQVEEKREGKAV